MREAMRARAVLSVLLLVSLTLVLLDLRGGGAIGGLRGMVAAVVGPLEQATGALAAPFVSAARSVTSFGDPQSRSAVAGEQLQGLTGSPAVSAETARVAGELKSMLGLAGLGGFKVLPARVVAYGSAQTFSGTVTLDAGSTDGIATDMCVINGDGLVGKIISVGPTTATVQLITDNNSIVAVRAEGSGDAGALDGTGSPNELALRLLDPSMEIKVGTRLVTFGSPNAAPFAAGIPLGTVTGTSGEPGQSDRVALVAPAVRMTALDVVGVLVVPARTDPRDALLPAKPSAAGTPSSAATAGSAGAAGSTGTP
ncbi:MAG: rod shape-determining protein MreC [Actinomycetes bacterium]